ncbi:MAG TPA: DedA family protein [Gammaproteobacteria bacterium]|nr:inner membrane protein YohD [bacterium BMS3Abin12]HDK02724.1 DedA family protein [Gammaproteobacteria bacterium]
MPDAETLQRLIETYGYAAVVVGTFAEGEVVLLLAGFVVHLGFLSFPGVVAAAWIGILAGDQVYFLAGRLYGRRLLARSARWREKARRADALIQRFQARLIIGFRFLFGLRIIIPFMFGMGRVSTVRFVLLNGIGALIWTLLGAVLGYLFGAAVETALSRLGYAEWIAAGTLAGLIITLRVVLVLRARRRRPVDRRLDKPDH